MAAEVLMPDRSRIEYKLEVHLNGQARLIQSIVLDEETDVREDGRVLSHFAWYLEAMEEIGVPIPEPTTLPDEIVTNNHIQQEAHLVEVGG